MGLNVKRPLVSLTLAFCLGIIWGNYIKITFLWPYVIGIILLVSSFILFRKGVFFDISILLLVFILGVVSIRNSFILSKHHIYKYYLSHKKDKPPYYIIKGFITNEPMINKNRTCFVLRAQQLQLDNLNRNCSGDILVSIKDKIEFNYGETLLLKGSLCQPSGFGFQKRQTYRDYLRNQNIWLIMRVDSGADILRLNSNRGFFVKRLALDFKAKAEGIISKYLSRDASSILEAMVLGEKRNIPPYIIKAMIETGTVHILVVSGFNVGIVTFVIVLFFKLMRIPKRIRIYLTIIFAIFYCILTGASTPVVRATIMAIVFMLAYLIKREPDIYNSLCVSAVCILVSNPRQLFDVGFQLSFASVVSIVWLYPRMKSITQLVKIKLGWVRFILEGFLVSFSAWLGTLGFVAYYFKIFSPLTVIANLLIVPLASFVTLCGFSLIILGMIFPSLIWPFVRVEELAVATLLGTTDFLVRLSRTFIRFCF
ncbi:MAG: ComEC family competence protein [Candidatus Omnitrophica bacterium]|nr:ComEC family competence protein [Candidatus Omnitrophota bacterium]